MEEICQLPLSDFHHVNYFIPHSINGKAKPLINVINKSHKFIVQTGFALTEALRPLGLFFLISKGNYSERNGVMFFKDASICT